MAWTFIQLCARVRSLQVSVRLSYCNEQTAQALQNLFSTLSYGNLV